MKAAAWKALWLAALGLGALWAAYALVGRVLDGLSGGSGSGGSGSGSGSGGSEPEADAPADPEGWTLEGVWDSVKTEYVSNATDFWDMISGS